MSGSSEMQPFKFESWEVRFVGSADEPEWVARDVVLILYGENSRNNITNYLSKVPAEWKGIKQINTPGGTQEVVTLFEPGLYCLIARSESPWAVRFQKWVYEEVLPSIRTTGSYSIVNTSPPYQGLPPAKERLDNIRLGMDLLYELGGIDERTQLALRDIVRDVLLDDKLKKPSLPGSGRLEWPVSDRARHLGYMPKGPQLQKIGKVAAQLYRLAHGGQAPPEREQYVGGTTRMVKCYGEADLEILDRAISLVMEPPAQLPPGSALDVDFE